MSEALMGELMQVLLVLGAALLIVGTLGALQRGRRAMEITGEVLRMKSGRASCRPLALSELVGRTTARPTAPGLSVRPLTAPFNSASLPPPEPRR